MADVKWIKIATDIFDDEKILLIESLPEADSIIVIWFKLLCLAGKINNSGVFTLNDKLPYTDKMLATIFRRKETTVKMALETFRQFGMIEIIDDTITIPNWGKHQSLDKLEKRREYMRTYMTDYRQKQKEITCKVNDKVNSKVNVNSLDKDIDKDIDKKEIQKKEVDTEEVELPSIEESIEKAIKGMGKDINECEPPKDDFGFDTDSAWWEIVNKVYPQNKIGKTRIAKDMFISLLDGAFYPREIANTVVDAINMYVTDYRKNNDTDKYIKDIGNWFTDDFEYWFRKATEMRSKRRSMKNGTTTQSDE